MEQGLLLQKSFPYERIKQKKTKPKPASKIAPLKKPQILPVYPPLFTFLIYTVRVTYSFAVSFTFSCSVKISDLNVQWVSSEVLGQLFTFAVHQRFLYMLLVEKNRKSLHRLLLQGRVNWLPYSNKYFTYQSPDVIDSWHGEGTGMLFEVFWPIVFLAGSAALQFSSSKTWNKHPPVQDCVSALLGSERRTLPVSTFS